MRLSIGLSIVVLFLPGALSSACEPLNPVVSEFPNVQQDWHPKNQKAEFSFGWMLPYERLNSLDETVAWLTKNEFLGKVESEPEIDVRYFTIEQPMTLPSGYRAMLRKRGMDNFTYKVRGSAPAPPGSIATPCSPDPTDDEWDVTTNGKGMPIQRMATFSCEASDLAKLAIKPRPCRITMKRVRIAWPGHKDVKVEQWRFETYPKVTPVKYLLEVSWKGKASIDDETAFSSLISSLPDGAAPQAFLGKEKMAEACDANGE